jgi:hypothetical protein
MSKITKSPPQRRTHQGLSDSTSTHQGLSDSTSTHKWLSNSTKSAMGSFWFGT